MPQKLNITAEQVQDAQKQSEEMIPTVEGAKSYFAYVDYHGTGILCILDGGKWRPTTRDEMTRLLI